VNVVWTKHYDEFSERVEIKGSDNEILYIGKFQSDDVGTYACTVFNLDSNRILKNLIEVDIVESYYTNNYQFSVRNTPITPYLSLNIIEPLQQTNQIAMLKAKCSSGGKV
jgi:hypothetical protein